MKNVKNVLIAILMLLLSFSACADEWSQADTNREYVYLTLHAIDWAQTLQFHKQDIIENGYIARTVIGTTPSNRQINQYMVGSALIQYGIARALPREWRSKFQVVAILDAGASVVNNFSIGVRIPI